MKFKNKFKKAKLKSICFNLKKGLHLEMLLIGYFNQYFSIRFGTANNIFMVEICGEKGKFRALKCLLSK